MLNRSAQFTFQPLLACLMLGIAVFLAGCQARDKEPPQTTDAPVSQAGGEEVPPAGDAMAPEVENEGPAAQEPPPAAAKPAGEISPGTSASPGSQWGHLRGRFVFDGPPPQQKPVTVTSDVEYCSAHHPLDESMVVNQDNGGLANVIVALFQGRGEAPLKVIHPSFEATANDKIEIDNLKCRFSPHVLLLRTSQTLVIVNSDKIAHNTKIDTLNNPPINPTLPAGGELERNFANPERVAARVSCSIHPWMCAWIAIRSDPYFAASKADGSFEIKYLPAGTWTFQAWHERARFVTEVTLDGQKTQWSKGRFTVEVPSDGTVDLGEIKLNPEIFGDL